jgi:hypothetical protein
VKLEYVVGGLLMVFGLVSAVRSLVSPATADERRIRLLIAIHDAAKAMFWISLGGFFVLYAAAEEQDVVRWLALVPIGMAAIRLLSASVLSRT